MLIKHNEYRKDNAMKTKEKKGVQIEVKTGTFGDLLESLFEELMDDELSKDVDLYEKIADLFDEQSISSQMTTIKCLLGKWKHNLEESIKEELKEDANS